MPAPVHTPIYAPLGLRSAALTTDARLYNGFVEKNLDDGGLDVFKRPGMNLRAQVAPGAAVGRGVFSWNGNIYSIFDGVFYREIAAIGAVQDSGLYTFSSCLGATPKLFFQNKSVAYTYDSGAGLVQVTDGDYPAATVSGSAYLDGTTYVGAVPASLRGSDFNDPQSWDPLNTIVAQIEPDFIIAVAKQLTYAIALKEFSTEVFYDAGQPVGSPLGPVQGSKVGIGCKADGSVCHIGDDLGWIGTTIEGDVQALLMSKLKAEIVSTPPVDRLLQSLSYNTVWSWAARVSGHRFYVVTFRESNLTLAYDLTSKAWYIWTDSNGNYMPIVSATFRLTDSLAVLQHATNGKLYNFLASEYGDEGAAFPWRCFTSRMDGGLRIQKANAKLELVADRIATSVNVSWSDDDYQTFTTPQAVSLDQDRVWLQDGGAFSTRAYCLEHSALTFLRIKGLDLSSTPGTI